MTVQKATSSFLGSLDDQIAANLTAVQKTNALAIALAGRRSQNTSQTPLRELTSQISRGVAPKYDDLGKYVVLNQKCIRDSQVDIARARSMKSLPKSPGKVLRQNDVLVNSTGQGTLGRIARWTSSDPNTSVDTHVSIVRFDPEVADPAFAGTVLSTMGSGGRSCRRQYWTNRVEAGPLGKSKAQPSPSRRTTRSRSADQAFG